MTQRTDSDPKTLRSTRLRTLLIRSLSCIGGLGILSNGLSLAQSEVRLDSVVVPGANSKLPAATTAPVKSTTATLNPASTAEQLGQTQPKVSTSASDLSLDRVGSVAVPSRTISSPVQEQPIAPPQTTATTPIDSNSPYIDSTDYSIGATPNPNLPSSVVASKRSTDCKAVLRQGMSSSLCGAVAIPSSTAFKQPNQQITRSLALAQAALAGRTKLPLAQLPGWASRGVAIAALGPVRLGSMTPAANQGQVALRNVMSPPNAVVYYNSTLQPNGQPSNTNTGLLFPLTVPAVITSIFGWRINPITGDRQFHSGTDLAAPLGTPVLAAYAGNVAIANYMGGYGLAVVLEHLKPAEETLYGHLSQIFVQPGQWVEQGTVIGRVGSTGNSTGPHLHFEIRQLTPEGWVATDPGAQLQYAMAQLVQALRTAQVSQQSAQRG